ncbi:MAG: sodium:calcium antiporter [Cetobacterium sp.]|uniref:sodium:calcium antiporter n=1 Tax=Cetobacterium sp. TaxID=2071632 RepID=UPI003EE59833
MEIIKMLGLNLYAEAGIYLVMLIGLCWMLNNRCDELGDKLEAITEDIKMESNIAGATFLAISSSLPEFLTSFMSIVVYGKFEDVGFATVAGSGIFNVLLIPMCAILAYKGGDIVFDKAVGKRDMGFYVASLATLTISMALGSFSWMTGLCLIGIYVAYIVNLFKSQREPIQWNNAKGGDIACALLTLVPIAAVIHISIGISLRLSEIFGVPGLVVSIIVLAAVTSVPDLMLSVKEAQKGDIDSATSNAIGSNIFDICICLGLPLVLTGANVATNFKDNVGVVVFLVASLLATAYVMFTGPTKKKTSVMGLVYAAFIAYVVMM